MSSYTQLLVIVAISTVLASVGVYQEYVPPFEVQLAHAVFVKVMDCVVYVLNNCSFKIDVCMCELYYHQRCSVSTSLSFKASVVNTFLKLAQACKLTSHGKVWWS